MLLFSGHFYLVQLMLNEFILHEIERLVCEDSMRELMLNMVNAQATELSDSSFIDSLGPDFLSHPSFYQTSGASSSSHHHSSGGGGGTNKSKG